MPIFFVAVLQYKSESISAWENLVNNNSKLFRKIVKMDYFNLISHWFAITIVILMLNY